MAEPFAAAHPAMGGKSLDKIPSTFYAPPQQPQQRGPYKSWRKKYRKMRHNFEGVLEDNKALFKEGQKLEGVAKRLKEEVDGLLEICLDLNESPPLPPELRFHLNLPPRHAPPLDLPPNMTPEQANSMLMEYRAAVQQGNIPPLDLHVVRSEMVKALAAQDTRRFDHLLASLSTLPIAAIDNLPGELTGDDLPAFLTADEEQEYLLKLDAKLGDNLSVSRLNDAAGKVAGGVEGEKHIAEMTPRELDRYLALRNPNSEHGWLKRHNKLGAADGDDNESLASHEPASKAPRRRGGKGNLAKQLGDRALERAREGFSPGGAEGLGSDDELCFIEEGPGSGQKRGRDPDRTYRIKGGTSGSGKGKGKRKRTSAEGTLDAGSGGGKKAKVEGMSVAD